MKTNWYTKKLGEICELINRGISPKYTNLEGICVLNQKCIRDHKIDFDLSRLHDLKNKKVSDDKFIQKGDVLVNSTGTGALGRVAQVKELPFKATVDSHVTIIRPVKNTFYTPFFGYAFAKAKENAEKNLKNLEELKKSILQKAFSGELREIEAAVNEQVCV